MDSKLIDVAGGRARIRCYSGGSGTPLLYLHDVNGPLDEDPFLAALATRFRVYAPLLPGYEDSEGGERLRDMLDVTLHTLDVMDALGLERPLLLGASMGGMLAAEVAALAPERVERLVLLAPAGLWLDEHPAPDLFAKLPFELPALLFHDARLGAELLTSGQDFEDKVFLAEFMITNAKRMGMAGKLLFPIPDRGLSQRLYRIRAKTLLLWGAQDKLYPPIYGEAFQRQIAGSELVIVPNCGHLIGLEQPQAVLAALGRLA